MADNVILTGAFDKDISFLDSILRVNESFDIIKRELIFAEKRAVMYYIDGFVKAEMMQKLMMHLITVKDLGNGGELAAADAAKRSIPSVEVDITESVDSILLAVMSGCTAFLSEAFGKSCIIIDARTYPARNTDEPENDRVMRGSRDGFVETMIFNTALIRRRIRDPHLTVSYINAGRLSRTDMALCYMSDRADADFVKDLKRKLATLNTESLIMGHQSIAESLIRDKWYNPFPKIRSTERPDAAAATILEGGVILICDNSPEAMIFPTSIFDFLQETDDYYFPPLTGSYLRILRHVIFWFTMLLTPLWYLGLMHADILPDWLYFIVPRESGEIPILLQLYLTEFALDGLKLASLNTPNMLSNSLSVVGGLLLGDFAVTVGWLSPDVILYMAFVAIANFTQQSYELGYAFKYMRMITLTLTALFDYIGFAAGVLIAIILIATNKTVNGKRNYLYPLIPFNGRALARLFFRLKKND
ncbi:MAG: spore germination protein [Clostridia bacterium]|nr:spore germination protein [Clostridia bacterium]